MHLEATKIKIEKNVPLPQYLAMKRTKPSFTSTLLNLKVGESILPKPSIEDNSENKAKLRTRIYNIKKKKGILGKKDFKVHGSTVEKEAGLLRIWRTK